MTAVYLPTFSLSLVEVASCSFVSSCQISRVCGHKVHICHLLTTSILSTTTKHVTSPLTHSFLSLFVFSTSFLFLQGVAAAAVYWATIYAPQKDAITNYYANVYKK